MRLSIKLCLFISALLFFFLQNPNHSAIVNVDLNLVNDLERVSSFFCNFLSES